MARSAGGVPGLSLAGTENRVGLGTSANPTLPPGVGFGSGMPRGTLGAASPSSMLNGTAESTGNMNSAVANIIKSMGASGGASPGKPTGLNSRGPRASEKPSVARSNAISRRLNGGSSRGSELKGL